MFKDDDRRTYDLNPPLRALASTDPVLAVQEVQELMKTELQDNHSRQLALIRCVVERWEEMCKSEAEQAP